MSKPKNIYKFLAYAKICSCSIACQYIEKVNYGMDGSDLMNRLRVLRSFIKEIENYIYPSSCDKYSSGVKHLDGKKVYVSKKSVYLESENTLIKSSDLNCMTEDEICRLASEIKKICINC